MPPPVYARLPANCDVDAVPRAANALVIRKSDLYATPPHKGAPDGRRTYCQASNQEQVEADRFGNASYLKLVKENVSQRGPIRPSVVCERIEMGFKFDSRHIFQMEVCEVLVKLNGPAF